MNLRQLRYIAEIADRELNISAAAAALHTSQPGISKQVRLLENELGIEIFERSRSRLTRITAEGRRVVHYARRALSEIANIHALSQARAAGSTLTIATSHTQARYVLPPIMKQFAAGHPKVRISVLHANPADIAALVRSGQVELGVSTEGARGTKELLAVPYRSYERIVVVPAGHQLLRMEKVTLKALSRHPLVTYEPPFTGRRDIVRAFQKHGLSPRMLVTATDADVIKAYVEQGLGVAVLSEVTFDPVRDNGLHAIRAGHLFPPSTTYLLLHRKRPLHRATYDFVETCVPDWTRARIQEAARESGRESRAGQKK